MNKVSVSNFVEERKQAKETEPFGCRGIAVFYHFPQLSYFSRFLLPRFGGEMREASKSRCEKKEDFPAERLRRKIKVKPKNQWHTHSLFHSWFC
jgi:hypothetical protein